MSYHWDAGAVETLEKLWLIDGMSASLIAEHMQGGLTRCSVIGKVRRLGLTRGDEGRPSIRKPGGNGRSKGRGRTDRPRPLPQPPRLRKEPPQQVRSRAPASKDLTILQITSKTCKYPYGDAEFKFCGAASTDDSPYCRFHAVLCGGGLPVKRAKVYRGW